MLSSLVWRYKRFSRNITMHFLGNTAGIYSNYFSHPRLRDEQIICDLTNYLNQDSLEAYYKKIIDPLLSRSLPYWLLKSYIPNLNELSHPTVDKKQRNHFYTENSDYCYLIYKNLFNKKLNNHYHQKLKPWRIDLWRNFPLTEEEEKESYSTWWHYDRYGQNMVSIFVNLTNTTEELGPFTYLSLKDSLSESFNDKRHRKKPGTLNNNSKEKKHLGKYNVLALCTDRILHRASHVKTDYRDMMRITTKLIR